MPGRRVTISPHDFRHLMGLGRRVLRRITGSTLDTDAARSPKPRAARPHHRQSGPLGELASTASAGCLIKRCSVDTGGSGACTASSPPPVRRIASAVQCSMATLRSVSQPRVHREQRRTPGALSPRGCRAMGSRDRSPSRSWVKGFVASPGVGWSNALIAWRPLPPTGQAGRTSPHHPAFIKLAHSLMLRNTDVIVQSPPLRRPGS